MNGLDCKVKTETETETETERETEREGEGRALCERTVRPADFVEPAGSSALAACRLLAWLALCAGRVAMAVHSFPRFNIISLFILPPRPTHTPTLPLISPLSRPLIPPSHPLLHLPACFCSF